ncbi:MAG: hypothetical protein DYG92_09950 [Leptolyngbya sp. PLA1]|nr:hypothetical protein [Leptolyngbya sp. PLA1]
MQSNRFHWCLAALLLFVVARSHAQSTAFTYQGRLTQAGAPASGPHDFRFTFFSVPTGGTATSPTACADDVPVADGLFSVLIALTPPTGSDLYLEIQTRPGADGTCASGAGFTTLAPRQLITPAPSAVVASVVPTTSPTTPGALRFNPTTRRLELFDGAFWQQFAAEATLPPQNVQDFLTPGSYPFVVPAGVHSLTVDVLGAGGGGGGASSGTVASGCPTSGSFAGGGGGGGCADVVRCSLPVSPGETLTIQVGAGGSAGATGVSGSNGSPTFIARGGNVLVRVFGGGGGQRGINRTIGSGACATRAASGSGGTAGAAAQFIGPGTLIQGGGGTFAAAGTDGLGAACNCAAEGGTGATYPSLPQIYYWPPAPLLPFSGVGGNGAVPGGSPATAGGPGMVRLYW